MKDTCFAILNVGRPKSYVADIVKSIWDITEVADIVIATDDKSACKSALKSTFGQVIEPQYINCIRMNVAKAKNAILTSAKEQGYKYVFIIEDDVIIKDNKIFAEYQKILDDFDLGFIFFGYGSTQNRIFTQPNPCVVMTFTSPKTGEKIHYDFNRSPHGSIMGFNLRYNKELFDETLDYLEIKEYLWRLREKEIIPFIGFFHEVHGADKMAGIRELERKRDRNVIKIQKEMHELHETRKIDWTGESNVDKLVNYVVDTLGIRNEAVAPSE